MAAPRVFISSTCYDLAEERDGLAEFCGEFGFDTTLSERGDVFYHPDLHTHESCVRETSNCHLFVLVIGGRFGGKYVVDPAKSITNAEYSAAIGNGTPTFAFVKQDVLNDHNVWQRNKEKPFSKEIVYPSIDKQEHAEEIFKFIDSVRLAPTNNGIFGFRLAKDIHEILRKQWASMMLEYLQNRGLAKQLALTNDALGNLSVVSSKIEELVKKIYRNVDSAGAPQAIDDLEKASSVDQFLLTLSALLDDSKFISESRYEKVAAQPPKDWWDFLCQTGWCNIKADVVNGTATATLHGLLDQVVLPLTGRLSKDEATKLTALNQGYATFVNLPRGIRDRLVSKYLWTKQEEEAARRAAAGPTTKTRGKKSA